MSFLQRVAYNYQISSSAGLTNALTSCPDGLLLLASGFFTQSNTPFNNLVNSSGPLSLGLALQKLKNKFFVNMQEFITGKRADGSTKPFTVFNRIGGLSDQISTLCKVDLLLFKKTLGLSLHSFDSKVIKTWVDLTKGVCDLTDCKEICMIGTALFNNGSSGKSSSEVSTRVALLKIIVVVSSKVFQVFSVLLSASDLALKYNRTLGLSRSRVNWINKIAFPVMAVSATVNMVADFIPNYKGVGPA